MNDEHKGLLKPGAIVQVNPDEHKDGFFATCFVMVTEVKTWGIQGFVPVPGERGELPGRAYCRLKWEEIELVGAAEWIPQDELEPA